MNEIIKVIITENIMKPSRIKHDRREWINLFDILDTKNIDMIAIIEGNLPLQGEKTLVRIEINLSLGEEMIRLPTIPQALQPYPIHIVNDCLPLEPHL